MPIHKKENPMAKDTAKAAKKSKARIITKVKAEKPASKYPLVRSELWSYDEYGQGSIVASGSDLDELLNKARKYASEVNVENALASGERSNQWEAYFPVFENQNIIYAGNKVSGKHKVYILENDKWKLVDLPKSEKIKFFLGNIAKGKTSEEWYLQDHKGNLITSLDHQSLERKTVLFIKVTTK
jgi:hypothetical protein